MNRVLKLMFVMTIPVIVAMTDQPQEELVRLVCENNVQAVQKLLEEPVLIDRAVREKAFLQAADLGNETIFHLLACYVSRRVHRKGVHILDAALRKKDA